MITVEEAQASLNEAGQRAGIPIDVKVSLGLGVLAKPGEPEVPIIKVLVEFDFEDLPMAFDFTLYNSDLTPEVFEVWLLGYLSGVLRFADTMDSISMAEEMEETAVRMH